LTLELFENFDESALSNLGKVYVRNFGAGTTTQTDRKTGILRKACSLTL